MGVQVSMAPSGPEHGHRPIIYMQCGPVRFHMSGRTMTETTPFEHKVIPRPTEFRMSTDATEPTIQDVYAALVDDATRNEAIATDVARAIQAGRCPLLLTGRTEHSSTSRRGWQEWPSTYLS